MSKIGTVIGLTGKAWVREADGSLRELEVGSELNDTQTIVLAPGSAIAITYGAGDAAETVRLVGAEDTFSIVPPGAKEAIPAVPEISRMIVEALEGESLNGDDSSRVEENLDESNGTIYGHNFVELVRVEEDLEADGMSPLSLSRVRELIRPMTVAWTDAEEEEVTWRTGDGQEAEEEAINREPVAAPETQVISEDEIATGNVLANDSDPENNTLTVTRFEVGGQTYSAGETAVIAGVGTIVINADGSYTFTPAGDWNGTVPQITYTISDGRGGVASSTLDISVTPVVDIAADTVTTHAGDPITTDVLDNDSFENGEAEVTAVTQGEHGTVVINPAGTITYTPNEGYVGPDSYTYTVTSGGITETTTVTIDVTNTPPVTAPEIETTAEDTPLSGNVLENETDADNDELTVTQFEVGGETYAAGETATIAGVGALVINADGSYVFTPVSDWNGTVPTITYTVSDGADGGTDTSTLDIVVTPVADISADTITTHAGDPVTTDVLDNDTFENGEAEITAVTQGEHGTVVINSDGTITYTPNEGYVGPDSYTYTVASGGVTETTTVTVGVTNTPPVASPETETTPEDTPLSGNVLANEADADGDTLTVTQFEVGGQTYTVGQTAIIVGVGTLTIGASGAYLFTPVADWNGTVPTVTYTVSDGANGGTDTSTLDIVVTPVTDIVADAVTTHAGDPVTTNVLDNDTFENEDAEVTAVTQGEHGTVVINSDGTITYTPNEGYVGPDSYTYTVTSGGITETTTVTIDVTNTPPVASPETETTPEDTPISGDVLANEADSDGDPLTVTQFEVGGETYAAGETATLAGIGTLVVETDGSYVFTPVSDWNGTVPTVTYTVSDGADGGTDTSTLDIVVTPVTDIVTDAVTTHAGDPVTTDVLDNDTFENSDAEVTGVTQGEHGSVTINLDGTITYTPNEGYVGPDSYTYTVTSGGVTETTTVTVDVTNAPPESAPETVTTAEDTPVSGNVLTNDIDADGDPLVVTEFEVNGQTYTAGQTAIIAGVGALVVLADGGYTFTPVSDWNGAVPTVTYTVSDGNDGGLVTSTLDITVTPVADIASNAVTTHAGDPVTTTVLANDTFENDGAAVTGVTQGEHGSVTINLDGTVTYTPNEGYVGPDSYTYTVTSGGVTETTTVTVDVTNTLPEPAPETATTAEDTPLSGNVLTNDTDADGDPLVVTGFEVDGQTYTAGQTAVIAGAGTLVIDADGGYTFTPVADWHGVVPQVTYTVSDGNDGGQLTSTLDITVTPVTDISADAITTHAGDAVTTTVLGNDTFENDGAAVTAVTQGEYGSVALNSDGTITYTPQAGYVGPDSYTYTVTSGGVTETVTVTIDVTNTPPVADPETQTTAEDTPVSGNVLSNDSDADSDALTVTQFEVDGQLCMAGETAVIAGVGAPPERTLGGDGE